MATKNVRVCDRYGTARGNVRPVSIQVIDVETGEPARLDGADLIWVFDLSDRALSVLVTAIGKATSPTNSSDIDMS